MKKRLIISSILFLLLSTYSFQKKFVWDQKIRIKSLIVENNNIISEEDIKKELSFLYETSLFSMKNYELRQALGRKELIKSFKIKKIYPDKLKITIIEKKPIFILQDKKDKFFYTDNDDVVKYFSKSKFEDLPIIFGDIKNFKIFHIELKKINFPIEIIKAFYFFESKRWDLITKKNQTIKLPTNNYIASLRNFLRLKNESNFNKFKIFDYRIRDQVILK